MPGDQPGDQPGAGGAKATAAVRSDAAPVEVEAGGRWWPLPRRIRAGLLAAAVLIPLAVTAALLSSWPSRLELAALVGPSLLPVSIWSVGSLPGRAGSRAVVTGLLVAWGWVAQAAYLNRYQVDWPLSEYDPVLLDLAVLTGVCAALIGQRVARGRRRRAAAPDPAPAGSPLRTASLAGLLVLATVWQALALGTAAVAQTPADDVGAVLGLPSGDLVVATGSDGWACTRAGEFCNASAGVASVDDVDAAGVQARLERHLRARGWRNPASEQVDKGLLWRVPMHVEIRRMTPTAVTVIVFWRARPDNVLGARRT